MSAPAATAKRRSRLKPVAIPSEHGGWGFLLEPLLLGLLVAPTLAGVLIALATTGVFLTRHPFKLMMLDRKRGRRYARTVLAERFVLLYCGLAIFGLLGAIALTGPAILIPVLLALPLAGIQISYDIRSNSRHWLPEISGAVAMAASAAMIALAGGWDMIAAVMLWGILAARAVPSILYVRTRLRLAKGQPTTLTPTMLSHVIAFLVITGLAFLGYVPYLAGIALFILLVRAGVGLYRGKHDVPAKIIGFQEIGYGLLVVVLTAAGYILA
ncbi:YwiC-like family protein [Chloroflexota bacterium]